MSHLQLDLNRIHINLQGGTAGLVRDALNGLEAEISRQLQGTKIANQSLTVDGVSLAPVKLPARASADQLRALLVAQILLAVRQGTAPSDANTEGAR